MLTDKVAVISSDKVFRRIKDVVDVYYLSKVFDLDRNALMQTLKNSGRQLEGFDAFLHRTDDLRHAYEKFRFDGGANKPSFDAVYDAVREYIKDILP